MAATQTHAARTALDEAEGGAFKRKASTYRSIVQKGGEFPPEAGRYHLYISYACPWANRCLAVLQLKGLEDAIGVSVVHPTWQRTKPGTDDEHTGWAFADPQGPPLTSSNGFGSFPPNDCTTDPNIGAKFVRDLYENDNDTNGKYTVPVFWDKKTGSIVNNESSEIVRFLNTEFNDIAKHPEVDLRPADLAAEIDSLNEWIQPHINDGVYRCGFAQAQAAYETAFEQLFLHLDKVEEILGTRRFLAGDRMTEADVRLFMTLIRFDEVYVVYFKTNRNFIHEFPNMSNYVRDLFSNPAIGTSVNMWHIKHHYFTSHPKLNYYAIVPVGGKAWWAEPPFGIGAPAKA